MAALIQTVFQEGWLEEEATWQEVLMIPNVGGEYRDIRLVEVVWKFVTLILNRRFTSSIAFHNVPHGFWSGCGTGTASLEYKILQQLMAKR